MTLLEYTFPFAISREGGLFLLRSQFLLAAFPHRPICHGPIYVAYLALTSGFAFFGCRLGLGSCCFGTWCAHWLSWLAFVLEGVSVRTQGWRILELASAPGQAHFCQRIGPAQEQSTSMRPSSCACSRRPPAPSPTHRSGTDRVQIGSHFAGTRVPHLEAELFRKTCSRLLNNDNDTLIPRQRRRAVVCCFQNHVDRLAGLGVIRDAERRRER